MLVVMYKCKAGSAKCKLTHSKTTNCINLAPVITCVDRCLSILVGNN